MRSTRHGLHGLSVVPVGVLEKSRVLARELWRRRLLEALARHKEAAARLTSAIESNPPAGPVTRDGWQQILEARFAEADALSAYIEALRVYSSIADPPLPSSEIVDRCVNYRKTL